MTLSYDSRGAYPHQIRRSDISVRNGTEMDYNSDTRVSSESVSGSFPWCRDETGHELVVPWQLPWRRTPVQYCPFSSQFSARWPSCHELVQSVSHGKGQGKSIAKHCQINRGLYKRKAQGKPGFQRIRGGIGLLGSIQSVHNAKGDSQPLSL